MKTSTGFHNSGANEEAVKAMLEASKGLIKVKASGGIRDIKTARRYINLGCERLGVGSSTTPVLVKGITSPKTYISEIDPIIQPYKTHKHVIYIWKVASLLLS